MELVSEYHHPDESFSGLEPRSKHRCPGHGLVPARRVAWGGASTGRRFLRCPLNVSSCLSISLSICEVVVILKFLILFI